MVRHQIRTLLATGMAVAVLVACGGGGEDGTAVTPVSSFPVKAAITYAYANGLQQTLNTTGTVNDGSTVIPLSGLLTATIGKSTSTSFNSLTALQSVTTITGSLLVNGQTIPFNGTSTGFFTTQYAPIGYTGVGSYCVAPTAGSYPETATAGQTGTIASYDCYSDSSKRTRTGTTTQSYVTAAGVSVDKLTVKLLTNNYDIGNKLTASGTTTYSITAAGIPTLVAFDVATVTDGVTVTLNAK